VCCTRERSDGLGVGSGAGGDPAQLGILQKDEGNKSCAVSVSDASIAKKACWI
jgi:hypothetical protein